MTLPTTLNDRKFQKFVESGGNATVRLVGISGAVSTPTSFTLTDLEYQSFVENASGDVCIRVSSS